MNDKLKKIINNYRKELILFLSVFLICFIIGIIITYYYNITKDLDILFDADISRVFGDLTIRNFNHYRTSVHPIYVLILQPIIKLLNIFIGNYKITIILFQSILSSISVILINKIFNKINNKNNLNLLLTILFLLVLDKYFLHLLLKHIYMLNFY